MTSRRGGRPHDARIHKLQRSLIKEFAAYSARAGVVRRNHETSTSAAGTEIQDRIDEEVRTIQAATRAVVARMNEHAKSQGTKGPGASDVN